MPKNYTFQLDLSGGAEVLNDMAIKQVDQSARAIAQRAMAISEIDMRVKSGFGVIKEGQRAIAVIESVTKSDREGYKATMALKKSLDAGRV